MTLWLLADHLSFGPFQLHDLADMVRLLNVALGLTCVLFMLVLPGSVWRPGSETRTGRALAVAVAFTYLVWTYAELEIILLDPVGASDHDADNQDGLRVYLTTLALLMTLVGLVIRSRRARRGVPA